MLCTLPPKSISPVTPIGKSYVTLSLVVLSVSGSGLGVVLL